MNAAEGFFDAGAIVGPALLTRLLGAGLSWKWLYVIAGAMCAVLVVLALFVRYPETPRHAVSDSSSGTGAALRNPYVLAFSGGAFLYVAVEAAVYVWMPTLLARGPVAPRRSRPTASRSSSCCAPPAASSVPGCCSMRAGNWY
jgi:fucose permease